MYIITCSFCKQHYLGSTTRRFHQSAFEYLRAAKNPASYKENALAEHYTTSHPTCHEPSLKLALLRREKHPLRLRHTKAIMIDEMQPKLNKRSEGCKGITPYMTVCSLATLATKHSIICLYMVLYYDERRTTKLRT